jgi:hypothetical protein
MDRFLDTLTARQYGEVVLPDASIRAGSWYPAPAGPENCHGARRVWRTFCRHGTNFVEHYECRGTSLIGATNLSPVTKLFAGTGAVSRLPRANVVSNGGTNCLGARSLSR